MPTFRWIGFGFALLIAGVSVNRGLLSPPLAQTPARALAVFFAGFLLLLIPKTGDPIRRCFSRLVFDGRRRPFNLAIFLLTAVFSATVCWTVFQGVPHLDDDVSALFQARIFASGRLTIPTPEHGEFFLQTCSIDARHKLGHCCTMYPPGHPAVLLPGVLAGASWLVNALLAGGLAVLVHEVGRQLYRRRVARLAGLLAVFSPFLELLAGTHLSHVPTAFFLMLCLWAVCRLLRTRRWGFGALAGFGFGAAFLTRPLTALVVGAIIALGPLWYVRRSLRAWKGVLAAALLAVLAAGMLAAWQERTTGDWRTPGHVVAMGDLGRMGFGKLNKSITYTPEIGWDHTRLRMAELNHKVLGWPIPLFFVALAPLFLLRARREDLWLLAPSLGLLAVFWAYFYYEFFFPARYIFCGTPMLILLSARGCFAVKNALAAWTRIARLPAALLAGCLFYQGGIYLPWYFGRVPSNLGDVEPVLARVVRDYGITNAVVFVDGYGLMTTDMNNHVKNNFFATAFMRNNVDFNGDVVYALNRRHENRLLAERFPGRDYYHYRYHRVLNKAWLFRLRFEADGMKAEVVKPRTGDLLEEGEGR